MPAKFVFTNSLRRPDARVAVCAAAGIDGSVPLPTGAEGELLSLLGRRRSTELTAREEAVRAACRNILRNGSYKPTGRGKPASEYLLGAAVKSSFPRVSSLVDINNLVSLKHLLPVSIWDAELCSSGEFEFRLGAEGERYVFNPSGQELDLEDLVCGCELAAGKSIPIVTPIKDGMRTKVRPETRVVIGAIYCPSGSFSPGEMEAVNAEFLGHLLSLSPGASGASALLRPGETSELEA